MDMNFKLIVLIIIFVFIFFAVVAEVKMRESIKKKTHDKLDKLKKDKKKAI
jgi:uncharacterized membrane protein